jgi:hypothetical protein
MVVGQEFRPVVGKQFFDFAELGRQTIVRDRNGKMDVPGRPIFWTLKAKFTAAGAKWLEHGFLDAGVKL